MKSESATIEGVLTHVVYSNEENSYTVAKLKLVDEYKVVTVVGNLYGVSTGETLRLTGEWTTHKKFGEKRIKLIANAWSEQKGIREIMIFLQGNGISSAYSAKIFKVYKNEAISVVKTNPYRLATDVIGIGFKVADKIAQNLGIEKNSIERARAGVAYVLQELADEGHVCYPYEELKSKCSELLEIDGNVITNGLAELEREKEFYVERKIKGNDQSPDEGGIVYQIPFY